MEDQRISKLIAETLFGICFVFSFILFIVAAVILTGASNSFLKRLFVVGILALIVAIGLAVLATIIKGAQFISKTRQAKKEFENK